MTGSLRGPDFPISAHCNAYISFCLLVYKQNKQTNKKKQPSFSLQLATSWSLTALNGIVNFIIVMK